MKRPVLKFLFNKISGLPSVLSKKKLQLVFSSEIIKNMFFLTTSGRAQDFTKNGSNSNP